MFFYNPVTDTATTLTSGDNWPGDAAGTINVPIDCAGLVVAPGDLVIGDADGVIAVPPDRLALLLEDVRAKLEQEEQQQRHHRACRTDPALFARDDERVDSILRAKGCPV